MRKYIGRVLAVILIIGLGIVPVFNPVPALAYTDQPDSTPTFTNIWINQNLITTGDVFIYGMYDLPYDTIPTVLASQTYMISIMNDTETIAFGTASPFVYHDSGYNKGIISWYFEPGIITWGSNLTVRIAQVIGEFASPVDTDISITVADYTTESTQAGNQTELAEKIFIIAQLLSVEFGEQLTESSSGSDVLSAAGETYFRGAIPGLQSAAPSLFLVQQSPVDTSTHQYTTEQFDSYATRFSGTWVGDSMDAGGEMLGMGGNTFMMFVFTLPLCIGVVIFTALKFKKTDPGLIVAALWMIMAAIMGWMPMALFATVFQVFGIYIGYLLFFSKSSGGLDSKLLSFSIFCYFISVLICVILEGTYFGSDEQSIFNGISFFATWTLPVIGKIPVLDVNFLQSFGRILTWDYSFYSGGYEILRWFWFPILSAGPAWGLIQFFINLLPSIISIFRPSVTV